MVRTRRKGVTVTVIADLDIETFVATEYPRVVAAVRLITGDRDGAADAVQDAIVGLLTNPPSRPVKNTAAYITVTASNKARDAHRRKGAEARALRRIGAPPESGVDALEALDVDVRAALDDLPRQQRQVCVLHYLLDESVESIAESLGVSAGTVKTQLHRGRAALAARIQKEDHRG
jgi:RNA polymerase sigma-70 factor (ECF subfamily)